MMNKNSEKFSLQGGAGLMEGLIDMPAGTPKGIALVAHPHPL
jgi:alpha/beta superfamily hydrolase